MVLFYKRHNFDENIYDNKGFVTEDYHKYLTPTEIASSTFGDYTQCGYKL